MDWQQVASLMVVGITAVLLLRYEIRRRKKATQRACGNDCGCSPDVLGRLNKKPESTTIQRLLHKSSA